MASTLMVTVILDTLFTSFFSFDPYNDPLVMSRPVTQFPFGRGNSEVQEVK